MNGEIFAMLQRFRFSFFVVVPKNTIGQVAWLEKEQIKNETIDRLNKWSMVQQHYRMWILFFFSNKKTIIRIHTLSSALSLSRFHLLLILTGFFCHSLSFLPFSIKLSMSFFASRQWWRLAIHHLLSGGSVARLSSLSFSLVSLRSLLCFLLQLLLLK